MLLPRNRPRESQPFSVCCFVWERLRVFLTVTAGYRFPHLSLQVLDNAIETEKMIEKYESLASDLLEWIEQTIIILNNRKFANSLVGVQQQLQAFNTYRTVEKPPK